MSKRGGGIAGPRGDVERTRAGDDGEYHHSRNLMKNMAVGRRSLSESRTSRGEVRRRRRSTRISPPPFSNGFALSAVAAAAARFTIRLSATRGQESAYTHQILDTQSTKVNSYPRQPRPVEWCPLECIRDIVRHEPDFEQHVDPRIRSFVQPT